MTSLVSTFKRYTLPAGVGVTALVVTVLLVQSVPTSAAPPPSKKPMLATRDEVVVTILTGERGASQAFCVGGEAATGGGYIIDNTSQSQGDNIYPTVFKNAPIGLVGATPTGWEVAGYNSSASPNTIRAFVVCTTI